MTVRTPGPLGVGTKVLLCLLVVLTAGLLGFVPAGVLAVRRKAGVDLAGAAVVGALSVLMVVCAVVAGADRSATAVSVLGEATMALLVFGAPTHYLLMDRRSVWGRLRPARQSPLLPGHPTPQSAQSAQSAQSPQSQQSWQSQQAWQRTPGAGRPSG